MAELAPAEKDAISHRGRAARALRRHLREPAPASPMSAPVQDRCGGAVDRLELGADPAEGVAGIVTGSVALLTEALHSATDLVASIVALFSLRAADVPADESHPYGHEKIEDMAAAIEGVLILVGSVRHRLRGGPPPDRGHGRRSASVSASSVLAVSIVVNFVVSRTLSARAVRPARRRWRPTRRT